MQESSLEVESMNSEAAASGHEQSVEEHSDSESHVAGGFHSIEKMTATATKRPTHDDCCCVVCGASAAKSDLECAICEMPYHAGCCGWDFIPTSADITLLNRTGWACAACCNDAKTAFGRLQANQSATSEHFVELRASVEQLKEQLKEALGK